MPGLEFIKLLRPVTYHYDIHGLNNKIGVQQLRSQARSGSGNNKAAGADDAEAAKAAQQEDIAIKAKESILYTGFVAQEVETAAKKLNYDFSGVYKPKGDKDVYGLSYSEFVVPLVKAVQELSTKNDEKDEKIASLEARLEKLEALLNQNSKGIAITGATLDQNSPNPFGSTTSIGYTLPKNFSKAQIVITDAAGKLLKSINVSGSGKGNLQLDASLLAAGAYHYSLYVDGKIVDSKQMISSR